MHYFELQLIRSAVLNDLKEFIPDDAYKNTQTAESKAFVDRDLAKEMKLKLDDNPKLIIPRQLAAIYVLERIGALGLADHINTERIHIHKNVFLFYLKNAIKQYAEHLTPDEAKMQLNNYAALSAKELAPAIKKKTAKMNRNNQSQKRKMILTRFGKNHWKKWLTR